MERDVYSGRLRLHGEEHPQTVLAANNYAWGLVLLGRFDEAKSLMRKTIPVARRLLGESHKHTLTARSIYGEALCQDTGATLDDLHEAVTTLEETERAAQQVFGGAHPLTTGIEESLCNARAAHLRVMLSSVGPEDGEVLQTADDLAAHFSNL